MKISCILTSYNRPKLIRQSLASLSHQTYQNFELLLLDESTIVDVMEIVKEFKIPKARVIHKEVTHEERKGNRLSIKINEGIRLADGDLICFLCDDDFYYPTWFEEATKFFTINRDKVVGFGKLTYSNSMEMIYPNQSQIRFFEGPIRNPLNNLDHNQVIHRRFDPPYFWPESQETMTGPDGYYFQDIAQKHLFHPIDAFAAVKRIHAKSLQATIEGIKQGIVEDLRE